MSPDVVIRGFGPAGAAAAICLARAGCRVAVAHRAGAGRKPGETLAPSAMAALDSIGVTGEFLAECPKVDSAGVASCWGSPHAEFQDYMTRPGGRGWHVDRDAFDSLLRRKARAAGVEAWTAEAPRAPFTIDATGRGWRRRDGEPPGIEVDRMVAVVRYWRRTGPLAHALIEAHRDGWSYSAPVPDGGLVTAFHCDPELPRSRPDSGALWNDLLRDLPETEALMADALPQDEWRWVSARSMRRATFAGEGWAAAGDAAASWDPLSGAGLDRAIRSGVRAARAALGYLGGAPDHVYRYQEECAAGFDRYLARRLEYYRLENRWPDSPFWSQRRNPCPRNS